LCSEWEGYKEEFGLTAFVSFETANLMSALSKSYAGPSNLVSNCGRMRHQPSYTIDWTQREISENRAGCNPVKLFRPRERIPRGAV